MFHVVVHTTKVPGIIDSSKAPELVPKNELLVVVGDRQRHFYVEGHGEENLYLSYLTGNQLYGRAWTPMLTKFDFPAIKDHWQRLARALHWFDCPKCSSPIPNAQHVGEYPGALSRYSSEEICSSCGIEEGLNGIREGSSSA